MATGIVHFFDASRLLSSTGTASSGVVYFYYTGTSTLAPVFTDKALTVPATNPVTVGAGGVVPQLFLSSDVKYRRRIIFEDGSVHDQDPIAVGADAAQVSFDAIYADMQTLHSEAQTAATIASTAADLASNALLIVGYYPNAQTNIPRGVTGKGTLVPGSAGTNGTFDLQWTGGNFAINPTGTFVVAGGVVTTVTITGPGLYLGSSPTAPTASFAASTGLTGASQPLVVDYLIGGGQFWWTDHATDPDLASLYYRNDTTATATSPLVTLLKTKIASLSPVISGTLNPNSLDVGATAYSNTATYYYPSSKKTYNQILTNFEVNVAVAGSLSIIVSRLELDNTLTLVSSKQLNIGTTGYQSIPVSVLVPAGCIVGMRLSSASSYYVVTEDPGGDQVWYHNAAPGSHVAYTVTTSPRIYFRSTLLGEIAGKALAAYDSVQTIQAQIGSQTVAGWPLISASSGSQLPSNYSVILQTPAPATGVISQVQIGASVSGIVKVQVINVNTTTLAITVASSTDVAVSSGANTANVNIPISAGQYVAFSNGYLFQNSTNPLGIPGWIKNGSLVNGDVVTSSQQHRYEIQATINTGLYAGSQASSGLLNTGLDLLAAADSSGANDCASLLSSARASHPFPYIRPGNFTATSWPMNGDGLWGPGILKVNGVTVSLPARPERGSKWLKLRAALMTQIGTGSALIFNGDSISTGAYATNPQTNYVGLVARFANLGIALDEPVLSNFDNSDPSGGLAFYGLALSNPTTPTNGTNGPVSTSLLLQPGQVLTFVGAYERVDVTYQGVASGQLTFKYNGSTYRTVTCATSGNDVITSGGGLTSQTTSGSYSITNTGSNAVEITSLMRFGVKTAGSPPRLYVCRFAHGSYTLSSYGTAQIASMVRIATAIAGGTNHFLVTALGTNDSVGVGLDYAQIKTAVSTYVANWVSAGVPVTNMMPIMPWRWSYYAGTSSYEAALGGMRDGFKTAGVKRVIQTDGYDFILNGLASDGHPNDTGFLAEFNAVVDAFSDNTL
jgi:hypothetical protein